GRSAGSRPAMELRRGRATLSNDFSANVMILLNRRSRARVSSSRRSSHRLVTLLTFPFALLVCAGGAAAQQIRLPNTKGGVAEMSSSGPQKRQGDLYIADGDVDIHYGESRLRADHIEYNEKTQETVARGHVVYDFQTQHLEAEDAQYNV